MIQLGGNTGGVVDVIFTLWGSCLPFLCSAPSGHQREPQWLCHANAAISSGCGFSCICHLQIQEVKCSRLYSCHIVRDRELSSHPDSSVNKSGVGGAKRRLIGACQMSIPPHPVLLGGELAFPLTHTHTHTPAEILLSGQSLQKKCQLVFSCYQY